MKLRTCIAAVAFCLLLPTWAARAAEVIANDPQLQQAKAAYTQGQFPKAVELLLVYTETTPLDPEGWYWLGNSSLQIGRSTEAADALTRAVLLRSDYVEAYCPLGLAEYQSGNSTNAARSWKLAVSLDSKDERSKAYLGVLFYERGNMEQAETWLEKALAGKPDDPQALLYLGLCEQQLKHSAHAEELMRRSVAEGVAQHTPAPQAFYSLAEFERHAGRDDAALKLLEQVAVLCPEAHTLTALSDLYKEQKRSPEAERVLRQAVALNPNLAEAHYKLALLLRADQKPEEARTELAAFERTKQQSAFPNVEK